MIKISNFIHGLHKNIIKHCLWKTSTQEAVLANRLKFHYKLLKVIVKLDRNKTVKVHKSACVEFKMEKF